MLLNWIVRVHHSPSVDPHDDRPSVIEKQGISKRFIDYFQSLDSTLGQKALGPDQTISGKVQSSVSGGISQAKAFNEQKGVTKKVGDVSSLIFRSHLTLTIATQYYVSALNTAFGRKVHIFYTHTSKHVLDIHEEAKRLAGWHKTKVDESPADGEPSVRKVA